MSGEVRRKLIDGLHAEVGSRSVPELEAERDDILLGLLELRRKYDQSSLPAKRTARVGGSA